MQRRFQLHLLLNRDVELAESSSVPYRDFYNVRKVDNNVHLSACMQQRHLLQFMRSKHQTDGDRVVTEDGKTLSAVFKELGIEVAHLSVDKLDRGSTFQRFDRFEAKYSPFGLSAYSVPSLLPFESTPPLPFPLHFQENRLCAPSFYESTTTLTVSTSLKSQGK